MSFAANIAVSFDATLTKAVGATVAAHPIRDAFLLAMADGSGALQASSQFAASGSLAVGAHVDYDLVGGGLTDAFGTAIAWSKLKGLVIINTGTAQPFTVTSSIAGLLGAAGAQSVRPYGCLAIFSPDAAGLVVAGAADTITITNGDGSAATYTMSICGS